MKVLIVGLLKFPDGDAGSIRQHVFAKMLQELGHQVLVIGMGATTNYEVHRYDDVDYLSFKGISNTKLKKFQYHLLYWKKLKKEIATYRPDTILVDDLQVLRMILLKKLCKKNRIKLIHDSVEWYSPEQFPHGRFSLGYIQKNIVNSLIIDKSMRVITISSYLNNYFSNKGITTVKIPVLVLPNDLHAQKKISKRVVFTYAGQAAKKDYIQIILQAFSELPKEMLERFSLRIIGCSKAQIISAGIPQQCIDTLGSSLEIYGRVPHADVLELLKSTDFSLLIRSDVQRYAKAGFPTKFVESLANSTPVIANITSDLGNYLKDGYNGLVVPKCTVESLKNVILVAINMKIETRAILSKNALLSAKESFLFTIYIDRLKYLLED